MTMLMGTKPDTKLNEKVLLLVNSFAFDEKVMAVGVTCSAPSTNTIKHITIAVAPGEKPFLSNKLQNWETITPFTLEGTIQECN